MFPYLLHITICGASFYRLVWAEDYMKACDKFQATFTEPCEFRNANME